MVTEQLDGVTSAFVDLDGKKGTWEIDSSVVSADKIIEEIVKLGYKATVA
jgi:copper chaperone CopZ